MRTLVPSAVRMEMRNITAARERLNKQLAALKPRLDALQLRCEHGNEVNRSDYSDEYWVECADCGKFLRTRPSPTYQGLK